MNKKVKITILADSAALYNIMILNTPITEKRLTVYIKAAKEAYSDDIINFIIWIRRQF